MYAILVVAIAGLAMFFERFYVIVIRSKINGGAFIERVIQLVRAGRSRTRSSSARSRMRRCPTWDSSFCAAGAATRPTCRTWRMPRRSSVIPRLTRRLHYLPMLANVATLIGLFGTIYGLQRRLRVSGGGIGGTSGRRTGGGYRDRAERHGIRSAHGDPAHGGARVSGQPGGRRSSSRWMSSRCVSSTR